jgi:hypothetical protein
VGHGSLLERIIAERDPAICGFDLASRKPWMPRQ